MPPRRRLGPALAAAAVALALCGLLAGVAVAAFTSQTASPLNRVSAAPDFRAPEVTAAAVVRSGGSVAGRVRPGGSYFVYANVTDHGNPPSGTAAVTADVSALTAGATAVPLASGSFGAAGTTYGYRSAALTAGAVAQGAKAWSLATADVAGNAGGQGGLLVTVDATAPVAADVQTTNGGGTLGAGNAGPGDSIVFTFSEQVEPASVLAGWSGASTPVVVRLTNGTLIPATNDGIAIYDASDATPLALGTVDLGRGDYVLLDDTRFGTAASPSLMQASGNAVTVTLGALNGLGVNLGAGNGTMRWTPSANATDLAGNPASVAAVNESGAADREF